MYRNMSVQTKLLNSIVGFDQIEKDKSLYSKGN